MGETFNKSIINECPKHKIPYSGVCIEKNCYETGLICPKCNPNSCIESKGHKKMFTNESIDYKIGDKIKHDDYGEGVITAIDKKIMTVAFPFPLGIKKFIKNHKSIHKI